MSAENSARSVRQAGGLDPVRALQRVLYRSAKQDRKRRFHALYDKLARSDVMWRAWVDVATNTGAPGVDGVSIELSDRRGDGVKAFLEGSPLSSGPGRTGPSRCGGCTYPSRANRASPSAARHPGAGRPGDHGGGEGSARAYLRSRLPPGQLWVPAQALGPASPRSRPGGGQRGPGVGLETDVESLRRNRPPGTHGPGRAPDSGPAHVEAAEVLAESGWCSRVGWSPIPRPAPHRAHPSRPCSVMSPSTSSTRRGRGRDGSQALVRFADDHVALCPTKERAEQARALVEATAGRPRAAPAPRQDQDRVPT